MKIFHEFLKKQVNGIYMFRFIEFEAPLLIIIVNLILLNYTTVPFCLYLFNESFYLRMQMNGIYL